MLPNVTFKSYNLLLFTLREGKSAKKWLPCGNTQKKMKIKNINNCPLTAALSVVGGKWKPIIILSLRKSSKRFGQLDYSIPQVSRKVLSSHLNEMVQDGLITRHAYSESPPRVEYCLTEKGRELVPIFEAMAQWGSYLVEQDVQMAG